MKQLQTIVVKLLMLGLLAAGGLILAHFYGVAQVRAAWTAFLESIPSSTGEQRLFALLVGGGLAVLGLFGILPLPEPKPRRSVSFQSGHGNITIHLDSAYRVIQRLINKMPEVRSCRFEMTPTADGQELQLRAKARLNLIPGQSARTTALRVNNYIVEAVTNYLGLEDIVSMDLNVQDFTIDIDEQRHVLMDKPIRETDEIVLNPPLELPVSPVRIDSEEVEPMPELPEFSPDARIHERAPMPPRREIEHDETPRLPPLMPDIPEAEELEEAEFDDGALPPLRDDRDDEGKEKGENEKDAWSY